MQLYSGNQAEPDGSRNESSHTPSGSSSHEQQQSEETESRGIGHNGFGDRRRSNRAERTRAVETREGRRGLRPGKQTTHHCHDSLPPSMVISATSSRSPQRLLVKRNLQINVQD